MYVKNQCYILYFKLRIVPLIKQIVASAPEGVVVTLNNCLPVGILNVLAKSL